jgi:membrane protein YdbS with pleckstrin-like domain
MIVIEELQVLASTVVVVAANLTALMFVRNRVPLLVAAAAVVIALVRAVVVVRSVRSWSYAERDDDLLVRHGLFVRKLSIVPYARMQFVDVTAGPMERMFGLATVTMHTAAAASDARIPGLPAPEAARLRDRLSSLGDTRSEGL